MIIYLGGYNKMFGLRTLVYMLFHELLCYYIALNEETEN